MLNPDPESNIYADRDIGGDDFDDLMPHYMRHIDRMTREDLHGKGQIAAELAWRDLQIERLDAEVKNVFKLRSQEQELINQLCDRAGIAKDFDNGGELRKPYMPLERVQLLSAAALAASRKEGQADEG